MFAHLKTEVLIIRIQITVYYIDYSISMHISIEEPLQGFWV